MTKYFFAITAIAASLVYAGVPARAADVPSPSAFTIKGGLLAQSSSAAGNASFSIGADYVVHPSSTLDPINGSVYLDVLGKSVGGGIAIRNAGPVYVGAGVGFYSVSISPGPTYTSSGFGGKIFGGFTVAPHTAVELGYHILPQAGGIDTNGVTAQVALRF